MMPPFSSTRWYPTPEQRMILKELYSRGITNPNSSQIQRITAHLSLYGKIHGKNVFYWFQNHKARDRQKLKKKLVMISNQLPHYHHCYSFADPLLRVALQTHDDHHAWSTSEVVAHDHDHLPRSRNNCYHDSTFPAACCGNIRPLETLQLFPLTSSDHQNITASHL